MLLNDPSKQDHTYSRVYKQSCLFDKTLQNKSAAVNNIPQFPHKGIETKEEIHGNEINLINFHMKFSPLRIWFLLLLF